MSAKKLAPGDVVTDPSQLAPGMVIERVLSNGEVARRTVDRRKGGMGWISTCNRLLIDSAPAYRDGSIRIVSIPAPQEADPVPVVTVGSRWRMNCDGEVLTVAKVMPGPPRQ